MSYALENASSEFRRSRPGEILARISLTFFLIFVTSGLAAQGNDYLSGNGFEDGCTLDSDSDRLPDCVETNSLRFIDARHTGTSPINPDSDNDGLSDGDEVIGTINNLDLPRMGAKGLRKTILVEYDWFDDAAECAAHSHQPTAAIMQGTAAAFAASPLVNPDGSLGIDLIQDFGQGGLFDQGELIADGTGTLEDGLNLGSEFYQYKAAHFAANRQNYFHYAIMAHRYNYGTNNSSGLSEFTGDDMIITLACYGTTSNVRNTIMHELGHNLSLQHGGDGSCNYKPNYNSVMNYRYQFTGIDSNCSLSGDGLVGYSVGTRPTLNESDLDENAGICGLQAGVPADWNQNSQLEREISADINANDPNQNIACEGNLSPLTDHNDYGNLNIAAIRHALMRSTGHREIVDCQPIPEFARQLP